MFPPLALQDTAGRSLTAQLFIILLAKPSLLLGNSIRNGGGRAPNNKTQEYRKRQVDADSQIKEDVGSKAHNNNCNMKGKGVEEIRSAANKFSILNSLPEDNDQEIMILKGRMINENNEGIEVEEVEDVSNCFRGTKNFMEKNEVNGIEGNFLGSSYHVQDIISSETLFRRKLSPDVADKMISSISDAEIKRSMFDIDDSKAPGPDGFTTAFFKQAWNIIWVDTYKAVKEFFSSGKMMAFTLNINGERVGYFRGGRGLRLGALDEFSVCFGLHPNHSKSTVFFGSMKEDECSAISVILPFVAGKLPVRYLSVPLILLEVLGVIAVENILECQRLKRFLYA
ncbi:hypothetical protein Tco_0908399 [Tanacetum coccineum]|uniref:Reverse transcriptase n=1 Tax=Tanacetum coccineum TaxID=301880 RepID=A0ABQ5CTF4_9ASTR